MKQFFIAAFSCTALAFTAFGAVHAKGEERIESFASDIVIRADGTIAVTEKIEYVFLDERHGIIRDITTRLKSDDGRILRMGLAVQGVTDKTGSPLVYEVSEDGSATHVKIGSEDVTVTGAKTYAISYAASGALRYFDDHDELYWNATGNDWTVPIVRSSATVRLPDGANPDSVTFACYTGALGSVTSDCLMNRQGSTVSFAANGPLTVVVGWAPGIVAKLQPQEIPTSYLGIPLVASPPLALAIALAAMFLVWFRHGRDPRGRGTLVVQYEPPDGMRPAEVGTLIDGRAGDKESTATIVDLAVRGYLEIAEVPAAGLKAKDYRFDLKRAYAGDGSLADFERQYLEILFPGDKKSVSMKELSEDAEYQGKVLDLHKSFYAAVMKRGLYAKNPEYVLGKAILAALLAGSLGIWISISLGSAYSPYVMLSGIACSVLLGVALIVFGLAMPRRTSAGVAAYEYAQGFLEYLSKAEKYRMEWQEKEGIFEKFLPYAMTFGVVNKWVKAFEGVPMKQPGWYHEANAVSAFNADSFASSMSSLGSSVQSSGFSGGSSGGGGGGGGGSSW